MDMNHFHPPVSTTDDPAAHIPVDHDVYDHTIFELHDRIKQKFETDATYTVI